jgi:hypothetical protein
MGKKKKKTEKEEEKEERKRREKRMGLVPLWPCLRELPKIYIYLKKKTK